MNHLVPCPECSRHVRVTETECPFCALPLVLASTPEPQLPRARLSRAATFAFGATLVSVTAVAACGGDAVESSTVSSGGAGGLGIKTPAEAGTFGAPLYGAAPFPDPIDDGGAGGVPVK